MITAAKRAREQKPPFLGIYLGMQITVTESARHVCDILKAGSVEQMDSNASPSCRLHARR
jgi:CTP synthase